MAAKCSIKIVQRGAFSPSPGPKERYLTPALLDVEQRHAFSIRFRVLVSALGQRPENMVFSPQRRA